ncbi:gamma carbonic anhydrase [Emiliania huxleyi CCMP1516]|uniref:Gamma carbonic anhydrase n=2 Tax=Emiliania huxleyi TaxID=2903 RepID=A0A0D3KPA8_EMIH1|nr:gamma carbonic anhydrase [Emiliania huxleyi CCMP1516]EOD37593.1 gamma carbonic anhydrase [Emiliania huxleyi CCMP1516]|eukprot:XP_005790022.1 gamma carbonic anhydrase [Emiliania huxleyi CCMP1516]
MKRVLVGVGKALRDTGQAVERMGMRAQDNWIFQEKICRHRALMNLFDQRPKLRPSVFVAPNASLIGNVSVMDESSIWAPSLRRTACSRLAPCFRPAGWSRVHGGNPAAFVRKLEKDEIAAIEKKAEDVSMSAKKHADEFLAYSNTYQLREQLGTAAGKI